MSELDNVQYEAEVQERWGDSSAYAESERRTKHYASEDWKTIKAQQEAIEAGLAAAMAADERFRANYEKRAEGFAEYVVTAIQSNQAREGT